MLTGGDDMKILEVEVFKDFMAVLAEESGQRQLKIVNLKTNKTTGVHYFDDPIFENNQEKTI